MIDLLKDDVPKYIQDAKAAIGLIREQHNNPSFCLGYAWATFAKQLSDAGIETPVAPWRREHP